MAQDSEISGDRSRIPLGQSSRFGYPPAVKNGSGCGSAWLERLVRDQEVAGSNPVTPTYTTEEPALSCSEMDNS